MAAGKEDIAPELLKKVQEDYRKRCENDKELARIEALAESGKANGKDTDAYAVRAGELLAAALHDNVSGDVLPDGKMYFNIANRVLPPVLKDNYELVAGMSTRIQQVLNDNAGLHMKALRPDLNEDRVKGLVNLAANADQYEDKRKELEADVVNFSQRISADGFHKNAEFQYTSGLNPKIRREAESGCCKWCQALEGTYDYADVRDTGNDVWRRHRDCRCVVEYDPGDGRRQNAHTKTWSQADDHRKKIEDAERVMEERENFYVEKGQNDDAKYGKIVIDGDEFVPCLKDTSTGEIVDTMVEEVNRKELTKYNIQTGWYVNWSKIPKEATIYKLTVKGDDEIQGLIAMTPNNDYKAMYLNWAVAAPHNNPVLLDGKQKKYEGVGGHLMAIAAEKSIEKGYGGAAYGFAANKELVNYYIEKFGAEFLPIEHPYEVFYSEESMKRLLELYNYEWRKK